MFVLQDLVRVTDVVERHGLLDDDVNLSVVDQSADRFDIITQRPTNEFGGYVSAEAGNYHMMNLEGAMNLPLGDIVQVRVSAISRYHEGYRDNPGSRTATLKPGCATANGQR